MVDYTALIPDATFKDDTPQNTVRRIKAILKEHGIETEERWGESNVPHCYSLRVNILGTTIGSNGKGVTKEFALASGYGELMERLQMGQIWKNKWQADDNASSCAAQSQSVVAQTLLDRNAQWYDIYAQELKQVTGSDTSGKDILWQYVGKDGFVQATPFYCATTHTWEYLPTALCKALYGTNGGAAGNSIEEAIVQAISEIVERHHKTPVLTGKIVVPEVPEEVLQTCTIAYEIIRFLRDSGYRVIVKDCSLGTKFPVVCVCLIDTNTGKYHTHFGAHPNFEIALQRTLTESFQGKNIRSVAEHEDFYYQSREGYDLRNHLAEWVYGTSLKSPQFFVPVPAGSDYEVPGFAGLTNSEHLRECIAFFRQEGYDVLVRDCSSLGFPTCQVIIPGYSEALPSRLSRKYDDMRYSAYAGNALKNPAAAKPEELIGLLMDINQRKQIGARPLDSFLRGAGIPARLSAAEDAFLLNVSVAYAAYGIGNIGEAIACINKAIRVATPKDKEHLICIKRYLSMRQNRYKDDAIRDILNGMHKAETIQTLYSNLQQKKNLLDPFVLHCDMQCSSQCRLFACCKKLQSDKVVRYIFKKSKEMDQSAMEKLLQKL